jgi:hypothetical protein
MNGFSYTEQKLVGGTITSDWDSPTQHYTRISINRPLKAPPFSGPQPIPANLLQKVKSDLISKAKGQQWNAPVFAAEAGKTVEMVTKSAKALVDILLALRRGRIDRALEVMNLRNTKRIVRDYNKSYGKDPTKAAANAWLQTKYGWIPFMSDVRDATNTLMDVVDSSAGRTGTVRAHAKEELVWIETNDVYEVSPALIGDTIHQRKTSVRAVWHFVVPSADLPGRFGLLNPALVAWELVPFSFVADWFLPIGDYLAGLDVGMRFDHKSGVYGCRVEETLIAQATDNPQSGWTTKSSGSSLAISGSSQRSPMTEIPTLKLKDISFSAQIGPQRAISAIALVKQVFGKK